MRSRRSAVVQLVLPAEVSWSSSFCREGGGEFRGEKENLGTQRCR